MHTKPLCEKLNFFHSALLVLAVVVLSASNAFAINKVNGVYQLGSCQDMVDFAKVVNDGSTSANAVVTAPIDMSCSDNFPMIGDGTKKYSGSFDGQGYPISNLKIVGSETQTNVGLFGVISGGSVSNIVLANASISATKPGDAASSLNPINVGVVAGLIENNGSIDKAYASGSITTSGNNQDVGGVVGNLTKGSVSNALSTVSIASNGKSAKIGGVVGENKGTVTQSVYDGKSLSNNGNSGSVGGVVGSGIAAINSYSGLSGDVNTADKVCALNGGVWSNGKCSVDGTVWNVGDNIVNSGITYNASLATLVGVVFDANGGRFASNETKAVKNFSIGTTISAAGQEKPVKDGFTFAGWALTNSATQAAATYGSATRGVTLYAVWNEQLTITFDVNSEKGKFPDGVSSTAKKVDAGAAITSEGIPTPADYEIEGISYKFLGWALANDAVAPASLGTASASITVYGVWKETKSTYYTLTFEMGGHGYVPAQNVAAGARATKVDDPAVPGYTFGGWYTSPLFNIPFSFVTELKGNTVVYAKWNADEYAITYNLDGGVNHKLNPAIYTVESGKIELLPPTKAGYVFEGWFSDAGKTIEKNSILENETGNVAVYAKWRVATYNVVYLAGGDGVVGNVAAGVKSHGVNYTLSTELFTRSGYTQSGWSIVPGGNKAYELGATYAENKDLTLYPYWGEEGKYALVYDTTSAAGVTANYLTLNVEAKAPHYLVDAPARDGYRFSGWQIVKGGVSVVDGKFSMPSAAVEISGKYELVNYTIAYETNGAAPIASVQYNVESKTIVLPFGIAKTGYSFEGWYDNPYFSSEAVTEVAAGSFGDKTFYAKWLEQPKYEVQYYIIDKLGNLRQYRTDKVAVGDKYMLASAPDANMGYAFTQWTSSDVAISGSSFTMPAKNVVVKGAFEAVLYTLTWELEGGIPSGDYTTAGNYAYKTLLTAPSAKKTGYTLSGWSPAVDEFMPARNVIYTAIWTPAEVAYKVKYNFQNISGNEYTLDEKKTVNAKGLTESVATYENACGDGFALNSAKSETKRIAADGSTVVNVYCDRNVYEAVFKNGEDVLYTAQVRFGATPEYIGSVPTKAATAEKTFNFVGWDPAVSAITGNAVYSAQFEEQAAKYTLTWNFDGGVVSGEYTKGEVSSGTDIAYPTVTKTGYNFVWNPADVVKMPANDLLLSAVWSPIKYVLTLKNATASPAASEYDYGTEVTLTAATPVNSHFVKWNDGVTTDSRKVTVTANANYEAEFEVDTRKLTVIYKMPAGVDAPAVVEKSMKVGETYSVTSPAVEGYTADQTTVSGTMGSENISVVVKYAINKFTVTYKIIGQFYVDDKFDVKTNVTYGSVPPKTTKSTDREHYVFSGWSGLPATMPNGDIVVQGYYDYQAPTDYEIVFRNGANVLQSSYVDVGESPKYVNDSPEKTATDKYTYTFKGWKPAIVPVSAAAVYEAQFDSSLVSYVVSLTDAEVTSASSAAVEGKYAYGTKLTLTPTVPTGSHFTQWSDGNTENPRVVTVAANASYTAESAANSHVLTITYNAPAGVSVPAKVVKTLSYNADYDVASPAVEGYTADVASVSGKMPDADVNKVVTYAPKRFAVELVGATATPAAGEDGKYAYGTKLTLTPVVPANAHFTQWSDGNMSSPRVVTVNGDASYTAENATDTHVLTITYKTPAGVTAPATVVKSYNVGEEYSIASPEVTGHTADRLTVSGTMAGSDVNETVNYEANTYTITLDANGGDPLENVEAKYGAAVSAPQASRSGYTFAGWVPAVPATMPAENITLTASWTINKSTITFNTNGGNIIQPITLDVGATISAPVAPSKKGFVFAGWYSDESLEKAYAFGTMPVENITVYAKWEGAERTISLNLNGGELNVDAISGAYGSAVVAPTDPTKTGFTFAGWFADAQFTKAYTFTTIPMEDIIVYAKWDINDYTIAFNSNGGSAVASITQPFNSTVKAPAEPKMSGYKFDGWYSDESLEKAYAFGTMPAENITVYAKWSVDQFEIAFESNGGSAVETIRQDYNSDVTKPADPTKVGHTFAGWFADESLENAYTFGKMPAKNITVYAKWNVNQYTIDFDSDGGSAVASIKQDFGSAVVAPAAPTKVGYTFAAWVPALPETMPAENTSVKATWTVNIYIITYDLDGGVGTAESKHAFDSDVIAPENPTKTGYVFDGWYTEKALVNKYTFGKMPAKPFKLYAKWIPQTSTKYVVTRYFQNVDNDEYTQDKSKDEAYYGPTGSMTVVEPAEFAGYEGFSLNESKSRAIAISADGSTVVNAYYDRNEYSVIFKSEGKTFLTSHFRYGAKPEFPANHQKPEKKPDETSEYTFAGWNPLLPATMPANDITVDAVFDDGTKVKYQLVWDFDGGVAAGTAGVNYTAGQVTNGDAITYPEKVTMEGHHLTSWDPADVTVMPKGNLKLKAVWTPNDYTITLKGATIEKSGVLQSPVSCTGEGKAKVCKYVFSYGTQLSLIADIPPEDDEHFVSWADGTEDKPIYDNPRKVIVKGDASYETVYETMTDKNFHKLTITYVAPAGVVVPMEKVNQYVKNGLTYSVESPEIEGYTADKSTVSGTMGDQDVSVTVTYSVNKHKVIYKVTGDYFTERVYEFEREFDAILRGDAELNSITSSKMEEEGYTFHGWNSLRPYKMPDEDVVITGYYTKNSYKLQIVYVLKDGPLRTQYTTSGSYVGHKVMEERNVPFGDSYSYAVASTFTDTKGVAYSVTASDIMTSDYTADKMNVSGSMPAHDVRVDITLTANKSNILAYIEYGSDASKNKSYSVNDVPNVFKGKDATDKVDSALRYRHIYPPRATDPIEDDSVYVFNGWEINGDRSVVTPTFKKIKKVTKEIEVTYLDKNGNPVTATIEVYDGISADHVGQMISDWIKEMDPANAPASYSDDYYWHEYRGWVESPKGSGKYVVNYTHHPRELTVKVVYDEDSRPEKTASVIIRMVDLEPEHALVEGHARDPIAVITAYMKANGYAPTKERDAQYYYSFVVGTNTYSRPEKVGDDYISRPDWTKTLRQYPITFKNGTTAPKTISVDYGTVPAYDGETPTKGQTTEFEYTFSGWDPALEIVTGTFEYTAKFDQNLRKYKLNYEGATASPAAEGDLYEYGTEVTLTASPEEFHHFTSWTDGVTQAERKVTVDEKGVTYVATNEPNKYVLTVVYANPSEGKRTSHEVLAFGEKVHYVTQKIDGYTPVPESFDLTMPGNDTTVNVTYTAENYTITLVNATLDDDSEAKKISKECNAETNTCNYVYGYGTTLKLIPNEKEHYSFAKWVDGVTDNPRIVIVTGDASYEPEYVINTHKLTITYTTTSGAEAPKAYEATLNYNDEFSVTSPELEGHTPEQAVVSGTLTADAEYTVAYNPNNYTLTIHYVKKNGEAAAADYVNSEVPYLSEFSVTSPINERFVSDSAIVKGVMNSVDGLEITIPYTGKPYTVYAKYIPKYGSEDTEEQEVHVTYDYSHADIENAINDVLESNDPVIVPQKTYSLTEKFTFNKTWTKGDDGKYEPNFAASPREAKEVVAFVNESDYTVSIPNDGKVTAAEVTAALNKFFADKSIVPLKASTLVTDYTFNETWTLGDDDKYVPNFNESDRLQITVTAVVNGQDYSGIKVPGDAKTTDEEIYEAINNYFAELKVVPVQASTLTTDYTFNETWTKGDDGKYAPNFNGSPRRQKVITVVVNNMNKSASVPANGSHAEIDEAISVDIYDNQGIRPVQTSSLTHDYTFVDRTNAAIDHWKEFDDNIYIPLFDSTAREQKFVVAAANGNEYRDISVPNDGKQTAAEISAAINVHFADHGIAKPKQASTLTVDYAFTDTWQKDGTSGGLDRYIPIFNESARPQTAVQVQFANAVQKVTEPADVNVPTDGTVPEIYEAIKVAFPNPTHEDRDSTYAFKCWTPEFDKNCATEETLPGKLADKKTPFVANLEGSVKKTSVIVAYEKVDTTYVAGDKIEKVEIDVPDLKDPSKVLAKVNSAGVSKPTKTGYTFKAWDAYSYSPVAAADFESAYNAMPVSGTKATNIVYLAGWTINQYTVTFHGNGGTIDGKTTVSFTQDYKSVVTAPATQPTRANYSFDGWLDMPATVPAEDVTVKAKWKQNLIKVVFDPANPVYTGSAQVPTITVSSAEGDVDPENYIVSWDKDGFVNAGDYKVTVKGKENTDYTDMVSFTATYTISRAPIEIALSATKGTYTGLEHEKPALTVKSSVGAKPDITEDADAYTASWDDVSFKNAKTYTITVTGKGNYTGTAKKTYVIDRAPVKVTAVANTKVYGVKDPAFKATVTGLVNGESEDLISYTLPRDVGENAGIYKINPTGNKDQGNYTITYVPADFTITKNTNSLEVAMEGWTYSGKADHKPVPTFKQPEDGINVKFYAEGEPTYQYKKVGSEDWSSTIPVDAGTYTVKASIAETANYGAAEATANFTITKFTENALTIALDSWDYDGTAHAPSTDVKFHGGGEPVIKYAVKKAEGEYVDADWFDEAPVNQGTYLVKASVEDTDNYNETADTTEYTINRADVATYATISEMPSIYYDGDKHTPTVTVKRGENSLVLDGDYIVAWDKSGFTDADTYTVTITGIGNYIGEKTATYVIMRAPIEIVLSDSVTYNGIQQIPNVTLNNKVHKEELAFGAATDVTSKTGEYDVAWSYNGDEFSLDDEDIFKNAGVYTISVTGKGNYAGAVVTANFPIGHAPVTVVADTEQKKEYGENDPETYKATVDGLVNQEPLSKISYTIGRVSGEDAGTYTITPVGNAIQGNYSVSYETADFIITRAPVIVAAVNKNKTYGKADPELTVDITGMKKGESAAEKIRYEIGRNAGESVGDYVITPTGDADQGNYSVSYTTEVLTISKATENSVTVTMEGWKYGEPAKSPVTKVKESFDPEHVKFHAEGEPTITYAKKGSSDWSEDKPIAAGTYLVKASIAETNDYVGAISDEAEFTIEAAPIEIVLQKPRVPYNGSFQGPVISVYSKVTGEKLASRDGAYRIIWDNDNFTNVAVYNFTVEALGSYSGNYSDKYEIYKADPEFTVSMEGWTYGETATDPVVEKQSSWIVGEPVVSYASKKESGVYEDGDWSSEKPVNAGDYVVKAFVAGTDNYNAASVLDDFTIERAAVTVVADAGQTKVYGESDPAAYTATVNGMVNGESISLIKYTVSRAEGEDVGEYTITPAGDAVQGNYSVSYKTDKFTITPAETPVIVLSGEKAIYSGEVQKPTLTLTFGEGEKALALVAETDYTIDWGSANWTDAGTYTVTVKGKGNFAGEKSATFEITQKAVMVVADAGQTKIYGDADPKLTATINGVVEGEDATALIKYDISRATGEDVGEYTITPSGAKDQGNYSVSYTNGTFAITRAAVVVAADVKSKVYGGSDSSLTATISGLKRGDAESKIEFSISRAAGEDVGVYDITTSGDEIQGNYNVTYKSDKFTITHAPVVVIADAGQTKVYGQPDPATYTATVNGMVNGESTSLITYTVSRAAGEDVGEYTITPAGDVVQGNYSVSYKTDKFTITPAETPVIVLSGEKATYSGKVQKPTLMLTFGEGEKAQTLVAETDYTIDWGSANWTDAGTYTVTVNGKGNFAGEKSATFEITQKAVTVVANADQKKVYGEVDPKLTATINGVVEGEDASALIKYGISRAAGEDVGEYTITPSGAASQGNYSVTYTNGTFAITRAAVVVAADVKSKVYGGSDPSLTATISGLKRGDAESKIEFSISRAEGEDVGEYTITPSGEKDQGNYSVTYRTGKFAITRAPVVVTADAVGKVYGGTDPELTVKISGLKNGEAAADKIEYSISRAAGEDVGEYTITPAGDAVQGNYSVSYRTDKFTITPAETPVIVLSGEKATYSGKVQKPTLMLTFGEDEKAQTLVAETDYTIDWGSANWTDAGTYTVTVKGKGNFAGEKSATFEITQKAVTVVANADQKKVYGEVDPKLTATINGVVEGEDATALIKYDISRTEGEDVGEYAITLSGEKDQGNYSVSYTNGTFAIIRAEIPEIALSSEYATYNGAEQKPILTLTFGEGEKARTLVAETDYTVDWGAAIWTDAGTYTVKVTGLGNFTGIQTADFEIRQKPVTITIAGASKMYGVADPAFTGSVAGLVNDSDLGVVSYIRSNSTQDVGLYTGVLDVVYTANANYDVKVTKGDFEITKRPITFTSGTSRKFYDGEPIVDGNVVLSVNEYAYEETFNCSATGSRTEVGIGENTFTCTPDAESGAKLDNYEVTYVIGTLTIDPVVSFAMNDHGSAMEDAKVLLGEKLPKPVDPTDVNYNFLGWFTDNETFKNAYDFDEAVNENKTLFAQWTVKLKTLLVKLSETEGDTIQVVVPVINTLDENIAAVDDAFFNHDPELPLPTKAMDEDSTYAFDGWKMVEEDVFVPKFKGIFRPDVEIKVLVNEDVVPVITRPDDKHDVICKKIDDELEKLGIVVRVPNPTDTTVFIHVDWMQNQETKFYEPVFKEIYRTYTITYVMPAGELSEQVLSYTYGTGAKLPTSTIPSNKYWIFKGWYTKPNGLGKHVKAVASDETGDKTYYAFFQLSVDYKVNDVTGSIEIAYTDELDKAIENALAGFVPEESGKMVFDKWVKSDTYFYEATFKEKSGGSTALASRLSSSFQVFAGRRSLTITGAKVGSKVQVIDGKGRVVYSGVIAHVDQAIEVKNAGSYMVRVNNQVVRVNIK